MRFFSFQNIACPPNSHAKPLKNTGQKNRGTLSGNPFKSGLFDGFSARFGGCGGGRKLVGHLFAVQVIQFDLLALLGRRDQGQQGFFA